MTQRISDSDSCPACGHSNGRHIELSGAGNGTKAAFLCLVGGCRKCSIKLPKKRKPQKSAIVEIEAE